MSEANVVKKTIALNTKDSLVNDLKKLGIKQGDILLVHTSLSSLGWVCGQEKAVVEALLEAVGQEGTIVMPAHTGGNSDPKDWENPPVPQAWWETIRNTMPAFNVDTPTCGIGRVAEYFRSYRGTLRSHHPHVSFCANGKNAKAIVRDHVLTPQMGMDSPLGKLYERNAKILMIGTNYESCTALHLAEVLSDAKTCQFSGAMLVDGKREWVVYEDVDYQVDHFEAIGQTYEKLRGAYTRGNVGMADCRLILMRELVDYAVGYLRNIQKKA